MIELVNQKIKTPIFILAIKEEDGKQTLSFTFTSLKEIQDFINKIHELPVPF